MANNNTVDLARSDRYSRQSALEEIGSSGQQRLSEATVAVVGLGALGSVAAELLVRAGVGKLLLLDRDCVELSNLQRQSLYTEGDALSGRSKAEAAVARLSEVNGEVELVGVPEELTATNGLRLLSGCDLVLDGSDNSNARHVVNDAALELGIPWVHGAATATYGVVIPFLPGGAPCYRCYRPTEENEGGGCAITGVLAATTHIVASHQVAEAMKLLIAGEATRGMLYVDPWYGVQERMEVPPDPGCPACGTTAGGKAAGGTAPVLPPRVEELCGDETIRLRPDRPRHLDLDTIRSALPEGALLAASESVVRFRAEEAEVTLFRDGRALIRTARGRERARTIYREYLGG